MRDTLAGQAEQTSTYVRTYVPGRRFELGVSVGINFVGAKRRTYALLLYNS